MQLLLRVGLVPQHRSAAPPPLHEAVPLRIGRMRLSVPAALTDRTIVCGRSINVRQAMGENPLPRLSLALRLRLENLGGRGAIAIDTGGS